jgi:hypothetical protein
VFCKHVAPALSAHYEILDDQHLDEIFERWPEALAADREVEVSELLLRYSRSGT